MRPIPLLLSALPLLVTTLAAQEATSAAQGTEGEVPRAVATRVAQPIRVDGRLDEAMWASAEPVTLFTQLDPSEGERASERTEVRIVYDSDALYIGARLHDAHPVTTRLGRRDMSMSASDWLTVILDSKHDHRTAFGFEVNPSGVRRDQTRTESDEDDSWDPVWEAATAVVDSGWVAEIRIPFSQLRFGQANEQTWGLQLERTIARNREFSVWSFTPRDRPGGIPRYGHLAGLEAIATGKRLEVLPYTMTRAEHVDRGGNPFRDDREYGLDAGVDLKYRVTSNFTLDATLNPDFGQVEVDPAVVNLTAFETFFPERRPFFIEGAEIFRFGETGSNSPFYSRRIGRRPSLAPPYAERDMPEATRILGAAKLSGRTDQGWTVGVLEAVTAREVARYRTSTGEEGETVAEPLTNYFLARVRREMRTGQSAVGGFFGAVNRRLETDALAGALRSAAYSGGVDLFHQWANRTWTLEAFLGGSYVEGGARVMAATQRLPYRYYQRPDATHLELDPGRESLAGLSGSLFLSHRVGRHWRGGVGLSTVSPGYEVSDLGFQRRADRVDAQAFLGYSETRPGDLLRRYNISGSALLEHNYAGETVSSRIFGGGSVQFLNYWNVNLRLGAGLPGTVDDRLTRGGPAARRPGFVTLFTFVSTDSRKPLVAEFGGFTMRSEAGGSAQELFGDLLIKPRPNWELSLGPSLGRSHEVAQFLRAVPDSLATHTYGTRYVFAELEQVTFALNTRLNYTFTPGLSLQVFAQPFIASGAFGAPKEFVAPGTFDFAVYGRDRGEVDGDVVYPAGRYEGAPSFRVPRPDFNFRSLRGNAVLRWEWRPGSTLYVAWQQTREDVQPYGDFRFGRDADAIFSAPPDNVLLVKVNYWLNP